MKDDNISAIMSFICENDLEDVGGPIIIIESCKIRYEYKSKVANANELIKENAKVQIHTNTFGYGTINIIGDDYPPLVVHTHFEPAFGKFTYHEVNRTLTMEDKASGNNDIVGNYKVTISI